MHNELHTEIDIDATPEMVWEVQIEASATGTRLVQSEFVDGMLVRVMRKSLDTNTKSGFEAMNVALKARAESVAAS